MKQLHFDQSHRAKQWQRPLSLLFLIIFLLLAALLLAACGGGQKEALPTPAIPAPTNTPIPPTATLVPATDTPVPPAASPIPPTPIPSATPDPAAGFETFDDEGGRVSFRYPAGWEFWSDEQSNDALVTFAVSDMALFDEEDFSQPLGLFVGEVKWVAFIGSDDPVFILDKFLENSGMEMEPAGELQETNSNGIHQVQRDYVATDEKGQTLLITALVVVNGGRYGTFVAGTTLSGQETYGEMATAVLDTIAVHPLDPTASVPESEPLVTRAPDVLFTGEMVLVMKEGDQYNLVRMDVATGRLGQSVTENATQPAWIAASGDLSFTRCANDACAISVASTGRHLVADAGVKFQYGSWSSDGKKLAFTADADGLNNLYVYDFSTDPPALTQLTSDAGNNTDPAWAVGDQFIVFASDRDGDYDVYLMRADGTNPVPVTQNDVTDYAPAVSPAGSKVAYISNADGTFAVYVYDINDDETWQLTDNRLANLSPTWSPDGRYVAYLTIESRDKHQLYVALADGSGAPIKYTQLPAGPFFEVAWEPAARESAGAAIVVDFTDPVSVLQAVFDSARLGNYSQLAGLCDPQGENDGDTALICEITAGHTNENDFVEYFGQGRINGAATINGGRAEVPFLFGSGGDQEGTMVLILRNGQWYLFEF